ncbi:MAG TPA: sugar phosphate isomerase/epimerase [Candidatus Saccharimonadales bacterium]|nr:sugar phosphate isomerase/epimerase [Candidatus Saccharimonadales bacterium]
MAAPIAAQLYTFRDPEPSGGPGLRLDRPTLEAIAAAGYLGVETVDVPGGDPVVARRALGDAGLTVASSHTWAAQDDAEGFERACAALAELGSPRVVVSGRGFESVEQLERGADRLARLAGVAERHGLRLGYHNHSDELRPLDGSTTLQRLADRLGPALDFQVDIFWVAVGGADPATVITALGPRVVSLHVKDGIDLPSSAGGEAFVNVPAGDGVVDPAPAIAAAEAGGALEWAIVEFDHVVGSPIEAVRRSLDYLLAKDLVRSRHA